MTTSTDPGLKFISSLGDTIISGVASGTLLATRMVWDVTITFLSAHWLTVFGFIFVILLIATIYFMFGRWGLLGTALYNLFYFGALLIIGLILGPEVFTEDAFNAFCAAMLYPACYKLVGYILKITGLVGSG